MRKIELIEIPEDMHDEYEMGISFDRVYQIRNESKVTIGLIYLSDMVDENLYIEWLEILTPFRGRGYLRKILEKLAELFQKEIHFECSEELRFKYLSVGCREHGEDGFTGLYRMGYNEKGDDTL